MRTKQIVIQDLALFSNSLKLNNHLIGLYLTDNKHSFIITREDEDFLDKRIVSKGRIISPVVMFEHHIQFQALVDTSRYALEFPKKGLLEVEIKIFI